MNHYETLNVSKEASADDIKKSYRKLAKENHPDTTGGDGFKFKQIYEAYSVIGNPTKRQAYDQSQYNRVSYASEGSSWNDIFSNTSGNYADMFNNAFGGSATGSDIRVAINITVLESYEGTLRYIDVGTGGFNINIPRGIPNGTKLKVSGKGAPHPINSTAPVGDAIITINVLPDDSIIVNGSDIYVDLSLEWIDLLLGGDFEVHTQVHSVKIKVPQGSHEAKMLRVAGKGMPIYNQNEFGNLMVKLRTLPINLTEQQVSLLKNIKE